MKLFPTFILGLASSVFLKAEISSLSTSFELLYSSDVSLMQFNAQTSSQTGAIELTTSVSYGENRIDYVPVEFDFQGQERSISEDNAALQISLSADKNESLTLLGGLGIYSGFTNYRSVWLDEYYRQQFSDLAGVPNADLYVDANPKGYNANAGIRWTYIPNQGFAQLTIARLHDDVSPGYEIDFEGLRRGELALTTTSLILSTENVVNRRIRAKAELSATKTSARSWRYQGSIAANIALGENWIARATAGVTTENPQFDATIFSLALERQLSDNLSAYIEGSYYDDSGEIENAFLFTNAAPALISRKLGLGLRWSNDTWTAKLYVAPNSSRHEATNANTDFFQNLYSDRDWTVGQFALLRRF